VISEGAQPNKKENRYQSAGALAAIWAVVRVAGSLVQRQ